MQIENATVTISVIPALVIMALNTDNCLFRRNVLKVGIMDSKKLTGKNMAYMIKSIWENNIMPVSRRKIKIVIPRLKMSREEHHTRQTVDDLWDGKGCHCRYLQSLF